MRRQKPEGTVFTVVHMAECIESRAADILSRARASTVYFRYTRARALQPVEKKEKQ